MNVIEEVGMLIDCSWLLVDECALFAVDTGLCMDTDLCVDTGLSVWTLVSVWILVSVWTLV